MNESQEPTPETREETPTSPISSRQKLAEPPKTLREEAFDRTTVIAFGLLFVLPAIIIAFTVLFFLPYMLNTLNVNPSGATSSAPNVLPPSNR